MRIDPRYRFLINLNEDHLEIHDLDDERKGCKINEILNYEYLIGTSIATLIDYLNTHPNFDGCKWCLEEYHSK